MTRMMLMGAALATTMCVQAVTLDLATAQIDVRGKDFEPAAQELEKHLRLIAGERTGQGDCQFIIGARPEGTPPPGAFESFARVCRGKVYFWGDEEQRGMTRAKGALFAVYEFLDRALGVKWVHPGDDGIVAPPRRTLTVEEGTEWSYRPAFALNSIRTGNIRHYDPEKTNATVPPALHLDRETAVKHSEERLQWVNRMREVSSDRFTYGHAFTTWQDRFLERHPEYLGLDPQYGIKEKGFRGLPPRLAHRFKFCLSNPAVPDVIINDWKARGAPKYLNVCPNDGTPGFCHCENCLKLDARKPDEAFLDHLTDRYVWFWNKLAEKARAVRPDVKLVAYIYGYYRHPPRHERIEYPDNFVFGIVPALTDDYRTIYDAWRKAGMKNFFLRPNYMCYNAVFPRGLEKYLYDNFKNSLACGMMGVDYDGAPRPVTDFEYYVIGSLASRPEKTFESIADEFYSQYGAAADEARAYYEAIRSRAERSRASFVARVMEDDRHIQDDSELAKYAVLGHTRKDLERDLERLKPGLAKALAPVEKARFSALVLRAEHALLTFKFLAASKLKRTEPLKEAAKELHDFRVANIHALGDEAPTWYSARNNELKAWRRVGYLPAK